MNMNRSNSFVSSLKWWPLQGHNNNTNQNNQTVPLPSHVNGITNGVGGGGGGGIWHFNKTSTFGSSVAVQKLRESKWFKRDEQRIFCAVVECGFLVEVRRAQPLNLQKTKLQQHKQLKCNNSYEDDIDDDEDDSDELNDTDEQDENATPAPVTSWFGIVLCKTAKDNKPKPESIEIFSVKISKKGSFKMIKMSLDDIWNNGWELRINNFADKEKTPHNEKDIRNQETVSFARKAKNSLWNNDKHFVYWCRYGQRQQDVRKRQMSECVKWGSVGMNAGMLLLMNKQKSLSTSK